MYTEVITYTHIHLQSARSGWLITVLRTGNKYDDACLEGVVTSHS